MSDTASLLKRISSFRERLQGTPSLAINNGQYSSYDASSIAGLTREIGGRSWVERTVTPSDEPASPQLLPATRSMLEEIRTLIESQRIASNDVFFVRISTESQKDALVVYHQTTINATETLLRLANALPDSAEAQQRLCAGMKTMFDSIRQRHSIMQRALHLRRQEWGRIERLARLLVDLHARRPVAFASFAEIAEELLDEVKLGIPLRFLATPADPVARFVAANSINTAQVIARVVPHDYEWAAQPILPVATALMMDVGLLCVSPEILGKTTELTIAERRTIERHPAGSAKLLQQTMPELGSVLESIANHHEFCNGTGYPLGRKSDHLASLARLLRVCDSYAARCSDRPHRDAIDPRTALMDILFDAENGKYDKDFAEYLLNLSLHPIGTVVELNDGRTAVVVGVHSNKMNLRAPARPVVAVLIDGEGNPLPKPDVIDLMNTEFGSIIRALSTSERRERLGAIHPDLC